MHESGGIFLKGHFGGSFLGHFLGHILGSFLGVRCCVAKVLSRNLIVFARNRCEEDTPNSDVKLCVGEIEPAAELLGYPDSGVTSRLEKS